MKIVIDKNIEKQICPNCNKQIDFKWRYICDSTAGKYLITMCSFCSTILSFNEIKISSHNRAAVNTLQQNL